jgi:hypothetical protein
MHLRGQSPYRMGLLVVIGQLAVRALAGGGALVLAPSGALVGLSTDTLTGTPFPDFLVPGLILAVVLGLYPAFVCYVLYTERKWGWIGAVSVAVALSVWVAVELVVGFDRPTKYLNLLTAGAILVLAAHPTVRVADRQT